MATKTLTGSLAAALLAGLLVAGCDNPTAEIAISPTTTSTVPVATSAPSLVIRPSIKAISDCSPLPDDVIPAAPGVLHMLGPTAFFFEDDVSEIDRERALHGAELSQGYIRDALGGFRFDEPICMDVRATTSGSLTVGVVYGANHVVIYAGAPSIARGPSWLMAHVVAHEYTHFWQRDIGAPRQGLGPVWLLEGSAELVAYQAVVHGGLISYEDGRNYSLRRLAPATPSLVSMERRSPDPDEFSYSLSFLASEFLTRDPGIASLTTYWRTMSRGMAWEAAFAAAFGTTPADFYAAFDAHRAAGFPR